LELFARGETARSESRNVADEQVAIEKRTLETIIVTGESENRTLEMIGSHGEAVPDLDGVALDDRATLRLLGRGHTVAVRYLNSMAVRSALRAYRVRSIVDLVDFFETLFPLHCPGTISAAQSGCLALEAYRDAYLKANHPAEFMAALVESVFSVGNSLPELLVAECEVLGVAICGGSPDGRRN